MNYLKHNSRGCFKVEDSNMVTNACYNLLNGESLRRNIDGGLSTVRNTFDDLLNNCFSGLLLFEQSILEDPNVIFMPKGNKNIGKAAGVYSGSNLTTGTLNVNESKEINDGKGYRYVWDFATDRGNGTIRSVALTSKYGGMLGYSDGEGVGVNGISPSASNLYSSSNNTLMIQSFLHTGVDAVGIFEKNLYLYATCQEGGNSVTFKTVKYLNTAGLKTNYQTRSTEKTVTTTKKLTASNCLQQVNDKLYSIYPYDTNKLDIVIFDGLTLDVIHEETIVVQDVTFYKGTTNMGDKHLSGVYKSQVVGDSYLVRASNSTKFYTIKINDPADYTLYEGVGASDVNFIIDDRVYFVTDYAGTREDTVTIFDGGTLIKQMWRRSAETAYYIPTTINSPFVEKPYILQNIRTNRSGNRTASYHYIFAPFLSTINNLSTPVVKNETQTMKVTYEITEI